MMLAFTARRRFEIAFAAALQDDLDDACATVQDAVYQTDGGLAGVIFSDLEPEDYTALPIVRRMELMAGYLNTEIQFKGMEMRP